MSALNWLNLHFILASASPRRKELLQKIGLHPEIFPVEIDETPQGGTPPQQVQELACRKARAAGALHPACKDLRLGRSRVPVLILASDTLVFYKDRPLGKAKDRQQAMQFLEMLSGQQHTVYTGVALYLQPTDQYTISTSHAATHVHFNDLSLTTIEKYLNTKEYTDKAGAYAIQGGAAKFIQEIQGDYNNVVGLPLALLVKMLRALGLPVEQAD